MNVLEIARRCAHLGAVPEALSAYMLALEQGQLAPKEQLEAALYLLRSGQEGSRIAYTHLCHMYNEGVLRAECLNVMTTAFYVPNMKQMRVRYEKNRNALMKYPYLFRKDFPTFEDLRLRFYPFDDKGYLPFDSRVEHFGNYVNFNYPVVSRNFFKNLDNPILAEDVYSQYELEYLYDNVRPSEDIGRENHIYLHYSSWETFCAYLQCINVRHILKNKKIVFLIEEELSLYPIDFLDKYGIDYSQYPVKPICPRDIHRLIWHTQFSSDNGGDFFNEVFDNHPNLVCMPSIMMDNIEAVVANCKEEFKKADKLRAQGETISFEQDWATQLYWAGERTDKDICAALFLGQSSYMKGLDHASRIAPALFFQPHFNHIQYDIKSGEKGRTILLCKEYDKIRESPIFKSFKYIKTFTPMRRFTTSYAATLRWMVEQRSHITEINGKKVITFDVAMDRVLNRSFMIDPDDRLYQDSVLVRFEDGKTNPRATFTALAAFLDIPYTESMTYCSERGIHDVETAKGNAVGFDTRTVYCTYDKYATDEERAYIEFCLRDAYEFYGYDLHYYDDGPVDEERIKEWIRHFTVINSRVVASWEKALPSDGYVNIDGVSVKTDVDEQIRSKALEEIMEKHDDVRLRFAKMMMMGKPYFINKSGQPLRMMPMLKLDPALLEQPLYH